jgi:hypothetical protein
MIINDYGLTVVMAQQRLLNLNHPHSNKIFSRAREAEISWQETRICPETFEYKKNAILKWNVFIGMLINLMQLFSGKKYQDLSRLSGLLTLQYQVKKDWKKVFEAEFLNEKNCDDELIAVRFSLPIIHAVKVKNDLRIASKFRKTLKEIK